MRLQIPLPRTQGIANHLAELLRSKLKLESCNLTKPTARNLIATVMFTLTGSQNIVVQNHLTFIQSPLVRKNILLAVADPEI